MKPTDKAICLDMDGNRIAVLRGYDGVTFEAMFAADSRIMRIMLLGRNDTPKGRVCRPV